MPMPSASRSRIALALEPLGARVDGGLRDPVPAMYDFMPHIERVRTDPDPDLDYDLIVVGDCGDLARVGRVLAEHAELFARVPILVIDHHASNTRLRRRRLDRRRGRRDLRDGDPAAAAPGRALDAADGAIAADLMAGVVSDTATFQHPNTTPRTLRVASELLAAGAPLAVIARRSTAPSPTPQLHLFGLVLSRLETADGRLVWSTLSAEDLDRGGRRAGALGGHHRPAGPVEQREVAILFKDLGDRTRISIRTREGGVDAIALTGAFGGGGHARAAGATVELPLAVARRPSWSSLSDLAEMPPR